MTDKMKPHIGATAHAVENLAKHFQIVIGDFDLPQAEMDGRNQVVEFDGRDFLLDDFAQFCPVPFVLFEYGRIMDPWGQGLVGRQMHLGRLSAHVGFPHPRFLG
jgi:hypothetical protein